MDKLGEWGAGRSGENAMQVMAEGRATPQVEAFFAALRDVALASYLLLTFCTGLDNLLGMPTDAGLQSTLNPAILFLLLLVSGSAAWMLRVPPAAILGGNWPFLLVFALVSTSPLWSGYPDVAMRRSMRVLLEFALLVVLASSYRDSLRALQVIWRVLAIVAVLDLAALAVPSVSFTDIGYRGVHNHKNEAGSFALLALPFALAGLFVRDLVQRRTAAILLLLAVLVVVVLSRSKTSAALSVIGLVLAFGLIGLSRASSSLLTVLTVLVFDVVLIGMWTMSAYGVTFEGTLAGLGIDPTLTGRDEVWRLIQHRSEERPWLGYGYGAFWDTPLTNEEALRDAGITFAFGQGHNGYLDVLIQIGMLGLIGVAVMAVLTLTHLFLLARAGVEQVLVAIAAANFSSFWLHNITESTLLRPAADIWVFFVFLMLLVSKARGPWRLRTVRE